LIFVLTECDRDA